MTPPPMAAAPCTAANTPYAVASREAGTRSATSALMLESSTRACHAPEQHTGNGDQRRASERQNRHGRNEERQAHQDATSGAIEEPAGSERGKCPRAHGCGIDQRNGCDGYNMILREVVGDDGEGDEPSSRRSSRQLRTARTRGAVGHGTSSAVTLGAPDRRSSLLGLSRLGARRGRPCSAESGPARATPPLRE